jgi:RNA-splicing ligase RtcB
MRPPKAGLSDADPLPHKDDLADALFQEIPAGLGNHGALRLSAKEMDGMLAAGAQWVVARGIGTPEDLAATEESGRMAYGQTVRMSGSMEMLPMYWLEAVNRCRFHLARHALAPAAPSAGTRL